jgi:hypothetical protein
VRALARKRGGERGATAMGQHPFKGVTTEVGDGPVEAPRGGQGTLGGAATTRGDSGVPQGRQEPGRDGNGRRHVRMWLASKQGGG